METKVIHVKQWLQIRTQLALSTLTINEQLVISIRIAKGRVAAQ